VLADVLHELARGGHLDEDHVGDYALGEGLRSHEIADADLWGEGVVARFCGFRGGVDR
jgi:hypothetical protein